MQDHKVTRRLALLGATGMLAGCETIGNMFGTSKERLPGERVSVLAAQKEMTADPALSGRPVTLPAPQLLAQWPQPGGGGAHAGPHASLSAAPKEAWRASVGTGSGYRRRLTAGPVVAEDRVFAADAYGSVSAFALGNGRRHWEVDTRPENDSTGAVGAGCAYDAGTLYVATGMAELLALEPATGKTRWKIKLPAPARGAPAVAGGRIFLPLVDNSLVAFSSEDGRQLWNYQARPSNAVPLGLPAPAVNEDFLVAGFPSGELVAMRPADGRVLWTESLAGQGRMGLGEVSGLHGMPVIYQDRVYAMGMGGTSMAVDLRSGRRLWERDVGGTQTPVPADDWLFLIGGGGELLAIGREDGRIRWLNELNAPAPGKDKSETVYYGTPILAGGHLILPGSKGEALLIDPAEGRVAGRLRLPGSTTLPGAAANGTLVFLTDDATLVAYR